MVFLVFFEFLAYLIQVQRWFKNSQPPSYMTSYARHLLTKFSIAPLSVAEEDTCRVGKKADFLELFTTIFRISQEQKSFLFWPGKFCSNLRSVFEITASKRMFIVLLYMARVAESSYPTLYHTHQHACSNLWYLVFKSIILEKMF